jgi:hypothetical protein
LQGDILDNDVNKEDDNDNDDNNDDNHFGMEYNATVYDGRENSVAAVHQARLSASPSSANAAASIAPDLSTLSRNGLINCSCKWNIESTEIFGAWSSRFATNNVVHAESITDQQLSYFRISRRSTRCEQIIGWKWMEGSLHH